RWPPVLRQRRRWERALGLRSRRGDHRFAGSGQRANRDRRGGWKRPRDWKTGEVGANRVRGLRLAGWRHLRIGGSFVLGPQQVTQGVDQAGEAKARVDVAFNDVERKVVETAESPDAEDEQDGALEGGNADPEKAARKQSDGREQGRLELHRAMAGQITHGGRGEMLFRA